MTRFRKKYLIVFALTMLTISAARWFFETRMSSIVNEQIEIYCTKNNLPVSDLTNQKRREIGVTRSIYDYTIQGAATHRIRFYVTIFGHVELHTLIE
jgi:hypothetical protein